MHIKRISAPKFRVGRYVLNEYELRNLQVQTAKGQLEPGTEVRQVDTKEWATIGKDGRLSSSLSGLAIASNFTIELIRINREAGKQYT